VLRSTVPGPRSDTSGSADFGRSCKRWWRDAAAGALIEMTAQCGGATPPNGQQHFDMLPTEPVAISFDESSSRSTDEIGQLEGGRLIYSSCADLSFSFSESRGLGVVVEVTLGKV